MPTTVFSYRTIFLNDITLQLNCMRCDVLYSANPIRLSSFLLCTFFVAFCPCLSHVCVLPLVFLGYRKKDDRFSVCHIAIRLFWIILCRWNLISFFFSSPPAYPVSSFTRLCYARFAKILRIISFSLPVQLNLAFSSSFYQAVWFGCFHSLEKWICPMNKVFFQSKSFRISTENESELKRNKLCMIFAVGICECAACVYTTHTILYAYVVYYQ